MASPKDPIQNLDDLIMKALKENSKNFRREGRPSLWRRILGNYEYKIQWDHCNITTELVEFRKIAKEFEADVVQAGEAEEDNRDNVIPENTGKKNETHTAQLHPPTPEQSLPASNDIPMTSLAAGDDCSHGNTSGDAQSYTSANQPATPSLNNRLLDDGCSATSNLAVAPYETYEPAVTPVDDAEVRTGEGGVSTPLMENESKDADGAEGDMSTQPPGTKIRSTFLAALSKIRMRKPQTASASAEDTQVVKKDTITIHPPAQAAQGKEGKMQKMSKDLLQRKLCLFETTYKNRSGEQQKMQFQTEKKTKSSVTVSLEKALTLSGSVDVNFKCPVPAIAPPKDIPDPLNVLGRLSAEMSVTKSRTKNLEEEVTWHVNNEVVVNSGTRVEAKLNVLEEEVMAAFTLRHTVCSLSPTNTIPIHIVKKKRPKNKDQDPEIISIFNIENLASIFIDKNGKFDSSYKKAGIEVFDLENALIKMRTEGFVKSILQVRQNISVKAFDIETGLPVKVKKDGDKPALTSDAKALV